MSFCNVDDVIPTAIFAVVPDRYKEKSYKKLNVGDVVTINDVTIVSYKARKNGEYILRKDGTNVLNYSVYFDIGNDEYSYLKNDVVLSQFARLVKWRPNGEIGEKYYKLEIPEKVKIIETMAIIGKKDTKKEIPVKAFESVDN